MKTKWVAETPKVEGWYWIKYRGKHGMTKCPAYLTIFTEGSALLHGARNTVWMEGAGHGGPGMKYNGKRDTSLKFYTVMIEIPS